MTDVVRRPRPAAADLIMGRYRLDAPLGIGGSAEVWRGHDERLDRPVAIKLLHPHLLRDQAARERLAREARAAAGLSHPGIVAVYDVDLSDVGAAIVLQLVEGETLADRLARAGALPPIDVARIGAEVADALEHAHDRGVIHRDVKPGNVLLDRESRARLADFGIARVLESEASQLTTAGTIPGTLRYLAPEQLAGAEPTPATDLYALGLVLYEMATGNPAFDSTTPLALAEAQRHPPGRVRGVPKALAAVWRRALDPDPQRRLASAAEMAAELRAAAGPIRANPVAAKPVAVVADPDTVAPAPAVRPSTPALVNHDDPTLVVPDGSTLLAGVPAEARWPPAAPGRPSSRRWLTPLVAAAAIVLTVVLVASLAGVGGLGLPGVAGPTQPRPAGPPVVTTSPAPTASPTQPPSPGNRGKGHGRGG